MTFCGGYILFLQLSRFFAWIVLCFPHPPLPRCSAWPRVRIGARFPQGYSFSSRGKSSYGVAVGPDHGETMAAIKSLPPIFSSGNHNCLVITQSPLVISPPRASQCTLGCTFERARTPRTVPGHTEVGLQHRRPVIQIRLSATRGLA